MDKGPSIAKRRSRSTGSKKFDANEFDAANQTGPSVVSPRRKSLIAPGGIPSSKIVGPVTLGERALETTLDSTTKTLGLYKDRLNALIQQNAELQRQAKQQETDAIEVMGALRDQSEKKDTEIIELRMLLDQVKLDVEKEKKEIHHFYTKKIEELNATLNEKDSMIKILEQEVSAIKDFKKKRVELMKEIESQKSQMEEMEHKFKESIVRIERKFFEEKLRMQKESNKRISELAASAHQEAVATLDETTKEIYKENLRLMEALKSHVASEEEIMKQNSKLGKKNLQLSQEKEMNDLIVREKITMTKTQNQTIRDLETKVMTLEQTLGHCIREFEIERDLIRDSTKQEMEKVKKVAAQLKLNLDRKSMEMKYIKKLSLHILDQRTQLEKFFMDALDYVRLQIQRETKEVQKQKKHTYTKSKASVSHLSNNQAEEMKSSHPNKFDDSITLQQLKDQSHLHLIEISNLSWEDKEKVLRVLFARMNGLLGPDPPELLKEKEKEPLKETTSPTSLLQDVEIKLKEIDV